MDTVAEMEMCAKALSEGKKDVAMKCIERLILNEHEADRMESRLCVDIAGGELSIQEREDLIQFVRKTDEIANWTKEAALYAQLMIELNAVIPSEIWKSVQKMAAEIGQAVKHLVKAVENLQESSFDAMKEVEAISDQERIVDGLYFSTVKQIYISDVDAKTIILIHELVESLEMAADMCEMCADTITILMTSRRG